MAADVLLRHDADLLRQRGAAPRARVHDDRRRRHGAPPPPARRGRVLPDRDRRARRAGGRRGRGAGRRRRRSWPTATPSASRRWRRVLDATNDFFIRTSDPEHVKARAGGAAAGQRQRLRRRGHLRGLVLPALRRLQGRATRSTRATAARSTTSSSSASRRRTTSSSSRRSRSASRRSTPSSPTSSRRASRYNEALSFISGGLQDVSLTRAKLTWGVPVPWDESHVFYVWFDALLNYYTALGYARDGRGPAPSSSGRRPTTSSPRTSCKFHAVFWPALLMAADLPLPEHVFVHGYLLMDGEKMSKSLGNVLDPFEVIDALRRRRAALLPAARRHLRPGRLGLDRGVRAALRDRAGQRARQPRQPHDRDDRSATATARCRRSSVDPALAADFDGLAERVAELRRPRRADARARARSGSACGG